MGLHENKNIFKLNNCARIDNDENDDLIETLLKIISTSVRRSSGRRSGVAVRAVDCWQ